MLEINVDFVIEIKVLCGDLLSPTSSRLFACWDMIIFPVPMNCHEINVQFIFEFHLCYSINGQGEFDSRCEQSTNEQTHVLMR